MKQVWIVAKETYLRHVKSWSFVLMVLAPFLILGVSLGVGYLQGASSGNQADKIALVSSEAEVLDSFSMENNFTKSYKDEAGAKKAIKEEKILGYVIVKLENNQIKATYHGEGNMKQEDKLVLLQTLNQLQTNINVSQANLSKEQVTALNRAPKFTEEMDKAPVDVACGLGWVAQHASDLGGDPKRIVVLGASAGGNLALNLGYQASMGQARPSCGVSVPVPAAVVAYVPIVDALPICRRRTGGRRSGRRRRPRREPAPRPRTRAALGPWRPDTQD